MALLRTPCQVASQPASAVAGARCFRCTAGPARDNKNWARDGWLQASEFHTLLLAQTLSQYFLSVLFFVIVTSSQGLSLQVVDPFFPAFGFVGWDSIRRTMSCALSGAWRLQTNGVGGQTSATATEYAINYDKLLSVAPVLSFWKQPEMLSIETMIHVTMRSLSLAFFFTSFFSRVVFFRVSVTVVPWGRSKVQCIIHPGTSCTLETSRSPREDAHIERQCGRSWNRRRLFLGSMGKWCLDVELGFSFLNP